MIYYVADMKVVDTTTMYDFSPQDERVFSIFAGPFKDEVDAKDYVRLSGPTFMLRFDGVVPTGIVLFEDGELCWHRGGMNYWDSPKDWEPHNLDTTVQESIEDACSYRRLVF